jgi:hypothetical protein
MPVATTLRHGDRVVILKPKYHGRIFRVVKIMQKNIRVQEGNDGILINCSPGILKKFLPGENPEETASASNPPLVFHPGETVRYSEFPNAVYVILKHSRESVSIAVLGGANGKYLRVPAEKLTKLRSRSGIRD